LARGLAAIVSTTSHSQAAATRRLARLVSAGPPAATFPAADAERLPRVSSDQRQESTQQR
jgi:hypothetical protein